MWIPLISSNSSQQEVILYAGDTGSVWRRFWSSRLGCVPASSGWSPGMLLSILQCTGRPHHKEASGPKRQWSPGWETLMQCMGGGEFLNLIFFLLIFFKLLIASMIRKLRLQRWCPFTCTVISSSFHLSFYPSCPRQTWWGFTKPFSHQARR